MKVIVEVRPIAGRSAAKEAAAIGGDNHGMWYDPDDLEIVIRDQDYAVRDNLENRFRMFAKIASLEMFGCHIDENDCIPTTSDKERAYMVRDQKSKDTGNRPDDFDPDGSCQAPLIYEEGTGLPTGPANAVDCTHEDYQVCCIDWSTLSLPELIDTTMFIRRIKHAGEAIRFIHREHGMKDSGTTLPGDIGYHGY
jgi:hypothetical protein